MYVTGKVQKTKHDDNLIYPFNRELGVDLINLKSNTNHKRIKIRFEKNQLES